MGKRYVTADWYDQDWFIAMPLEYQALWFYVWSKANAAGIWTPGELVARRSVAPTIRLADALAYFGKNVCVLPNGNWILPGVIRIHNAKGLRPNVSGEFNNAVASIVTLLNDNNVSLDADGFPVLSFSGSGRGPIEGPFHIHINTSKGEGSAEGRAPTPPPPHPLAEDITSPAAQAAPVDPDDAWRMERCQPWARSLAKVFSGLGKANWQAAKGLCERLGVDFVCGVCADYRGKYKWMDELENLCAVELEKRTEATPEPLTERERELAGALDRCRAIVAARGWRAVVARIGLANVPDERTFWHVLEIENMPVRLEVASLAISDIPESVGSHPTQGV